MERKSSEKPKIIDIKVARLVAVQCMYSYQLTNSFKSVEELAMDIVSSWKDHKYFKFTNSNVNQEYLYGILATVSNNFDRINQDILEFVKSDSHFARIPKVVMAVLQVAIAEIYNGNIDIPVVINEYLNVTSYLNHDNQKGFVNSVLDKIGKKYKR